MDVPQGPETTSVVSRPGVDSRFRQNPRVAQQVLGGKAVILHYEGKRIVGLNSSGSLVWSLLDGRTLNDVAREVATRSGAPADDVLDDVIEFVVDLRDRNLVTEDVMEQPVEGEREPLASRPGSPEEIR